MVIRKADGTATTVDYREMAPAAAYRNVYLNEKGEYIKESSTFGHLAAGVPGTVAGMAYALEKYGTMKWADVAEPARKLAADGFPVWYQLENSLKGGSKQLARNAESNRIFLRINRDSSVFIRTSSYLKIYNMEVVMLTIKVADHAATRLVVRSAAPIALATDERITKLLRTCARQTPVRRDLTIAVEGRDFLGV